MGTKRAHDCLVEIEANFFFPGEKELASSLEDAFNIWDSGQRGWEKSTKKSKPKARRLVGNIIGHEEDFDVEFIKEAIGFRFTVVSEGRCGGNFCCGLEYEMDHIGVDWAESHIEDFCKEAKKIREDYIRSSKPTASVRWLGLFDHHTSGGHGMFSDDFDSWTEYLGRVSLKQLSDSRIFENPHKLRRLLGSVSDALYGGEAEWEKIPLEDFFKKIRDSISLPRKCETCSDTGVSPIQRTALTELCPFCPRTR